MSKFNHEITADLVFRGAHDAVVSCQWCQRLIRFSDGTMTLGEVAQKVHLPFKVCQKLVARALREHWMEQVPAPTSAQPAVGQPQQASQANTVDTNFWFDLHAAMTTSLGVDGARLLQEAALMTRLSARAVTRQDVGNFLIALELAASDDERGRILAQLDELRHRYAA